MTKQPNIDPALMRGVLMPRISRRDLFRYAGVGAGALGLSSILAACGVEGERANGTPTGGAEGSPEWWAALQEQGPGDLVNFTNWPAYIDVARDREGNRTRPTLDMFTEATGIDVVFRADINDNLTFYAAIRPALEAGQDTGHDIIVITNGDTLSEMVALGYLTQLDHSLTPNFNQNVGPTHKDPAYDVGNKYTMAWQSGYTGIAWNTKYVKEPPTKFLDLFNEDYAGHIGVLAGDGDDPGSYAMLALGIEPETSTPEDWQKAADLLIEQRDRGIIRKFYDQQYLTDFENEDLWITMAWSGDIINDKLYFPEFATFEFVTPEEGAILWTDNMCIPTKAANPLGAIMLMDWYYKPDIAARLTEWNAYVSPVPAGGEIVQTDADSAKGGNKTVLDTIAGSPYVFPTPELASKTHSYRVRTGDEVEQWTDLFQPVFLD